MVHAELLGDALDFEFQSRLQAGRRRLERSEATTVLGFAPTRTRVLRGPQQECGKCAEFSCTRSQM